MVLLVEDNRDDERLAVRALDSSGLHLDVRIARDGEQALVALGIEGFDGEWQQRTPDLVISDLKMPKMSGDEVLARIRSDERLKDIPVIIFSSSDEASDVKRCLELGVSDYCVKPVEYNQYKECVAGILRRWIVNPREVPECLVETSAGT